MNKNTIIVAAAIGTAAVVSAFGIFKYVGFRKARKQKANVVNKPQAKEEVVAEEVIVRNPAFTSAFDRVEKEVSYNAKWANGTGYLDFAVLDLIKEIEDGEFGKGEDGLGRRFIIYREAKNRNWIIFERTSSDPSLVVCNIPKSHPDFSSTLSQETIEKFMTGCYFTE